MVELVGGLVSFLVSLLVGTVAIAVAASLVTGERDYANALVTALVGAVAWGLAALLLGWIPLLGWVVPLVAWVAVVNWRYEGGWANAAVIGFLAWLTASVAMVVLGFVGIPGAFGVPYV
jgi:hypothetical protein